MASPLHFSATVEHVDRHAEDLCSYRLRSDRRLPRFAPGQFIHLSIDSYDPASFWPASRVFSVANAVADRRSIHLTISRQGPYTSRILDELQLGMVVWAKGPYGDFDLMREGRECTAVFVAGGTGVTPFASYMDAVLRQGFLPTSSAILYYGARTPELLVYRELADRCARHVPHFRVQYYAQSGNSLQDPVIEAGLLDIDRIVAATADPSDATFYLSGPREMIRRFRVQLLEGHGIPPSQVLVDAWD